MDKDLKLKIYDFLQQLIENHSANQDAQQQELVLSPSTNPPNETQMKKNKKRFKGCDFLFQHPFFELPRGHENHVGRTVIAKCRTCGIKMRGNTAILSVFVKHMKDAHPEKYKIYEEWRNNKIRNFQRLPNELLNVSPSTSAAVAEEMAKAAAGNNQTNNAVVVPMDADLIPKEEVVDDIVENADVDAAGATADDTQSMNSDITVNENIIKSLNNMLDEKLSHILKSQQDAIECSNIYKKELNEVKKEVEKLREQLKHSEENEKLLQQELNNIEREMQRNSLLIRDLPFDENIDNAYNTVNNFFWKMLGLHNVPIQSVIAMPSHRREVRLGNNEKRSMIVTLSSHNWAQMVFSQGFKLRNSGIFLEPNLTNSALKRKLKMLSLRHEIIMRDQNIKTYVRGTHLVVGGVHFEWSILNNLCIIGTNPGNKTAIEYLNDITNLNLTDYINSLKFEN